jgi:uncharacterized damage-inducible protein DinB
MLGKLIEQNYWANEAAIAWLRDFFEADPFFHKVTSHVLNAESIWLARIMATPQDRDVLRLVDPREMPARNKQNRDAYAALPVGEMARIVDYKLLNGDPGSTSVEDIILHVWSHGFHHRGQMAAKASTLGLKYPNVAYVQYTRVK